MFEKLLVTGAAGGVAKLLIPNLHSVTRAIKLSDLAAPASVPDGMEFEACDLADEASVVKLLEGCDGVLHLGGISTEDSFSRILPANIVGVYNLYEAARQIGSPRIVFASSNHVVGYYRQDERIDNTVLPKPDSLYGVSKVFGESLARLYFDKFGIETAIIRIGSCFEKPHDYRMLSTWFSSDDFISLLARIGEVPALGCPILYGVSDNEAAWWDNSQIGFLGWQPQDSSRQFRDEQTKERIDRSDSHSLYQGGRFTEFPIIKDT